VRWDLLGWWVHFGFAWVESRLIEESWNGMAIELVRSTAIGHSVRFDDSQARSVRAHSYLVGVISEEVRVHTHIAQ
jgi:hypothetical protein